MNFGEIISGVEHAMQSATSGPWYGRGPKGSESFGGGCVATTGIIAVCNLEDIAALSRCPAHGLDG